MFTHSDIHPIISLDSQKEFISSVLQWESLHCTERLWKQFNALEENLHCGGQTFGREIGGSSHWVMRMGLSQTLKESTWKKETNQCCHPHYILAGYADAETQLKFVESIYFTISDNEQVQSEFTVSSWRGFQYLLQKEVYLSKYYAKGLTRIHHLAWTFTPMQIQGWSRIFHLHQLVASSQA